MNAAFAPATPPKTVLAAVGLHLGSFMLGFGHTLLVPGFLYSVSTYVAWLILAAWGFVLLRALYSGRNWARWLISFFTIFGLFYTPHVLHSPMKHQSVSIYIAQETLALIAMVLVFLPPSNRWFRHRAFKAQAD